MEGASVLLEELGIRRPFRICAENYSESAGEKKPDVIDTVEIFLLGEQTSNHLGPPYYPAPSVLSTLVLRKFVKNPRLLSG